MAERELRNHTDGGHDSALRGGQSLAFLVALGVSLVLSWAFAFRSVGCVPRTSGPTAQQDAFSGERINPNEAPVPSLMRLPQIGLARARAIVTYRDQVRSQARQSLPFPTADDLQRIKGIGPAIVAEIRPWLQCDDLPHDSNEPADR